jgi:hypothetical protein
MYIRKDIILALLFAAACTPQVEEKEETVICWTEGDELNLPFEKYQPAPNIICVPILVAPMLPPSIIQRAYVPDRRGGGGGGHPVSPPPTGPGGGSTSPAIAEFSTITSSGPVAGQKNADGTTEYSLINRETGQVTAVDGSIRTNANQVYELRDQIFKDAGLY